jgi:exosortase
MEQPRADEPNSLMAVLRSPAAVRGGILAALYLVLFLPQLDYLVRGVWPEVKYSHGYLIPLVSLWFLFQNQEELSGVPRRPSALGLLPILLGILLWLFAQINSFNALAHLSMLLVLVGMVLYATGSRFLYAVAFPIGYLIFAFPIPKRLDDLYVVLPLQRFAAAVSERIIHALGIPVIREGNVIEVPNVQLFVEEACSGLHSLYSLIALGTAFVFLTDRRPFERVLIIVATVPIAIAANVFRVTLTGVLAAKVSPDLARGAIHEYSGLVVFLLGLVMLVLFAAGLRWWFPLPEEDEEDGEDEDPAVANEA